jgi:hypothetical protein
MCHRQDGVGLKHSMYPMHSMYSMVAQPDRRRSERVRDSMDRLMRIVVTVPYVERGEARILKTPLPMQGFGLSQLREYREGRLCQISILKRAQILRL